MSCRDLPERIHQPDQIIKEIAVRNSGYILKMKVKLIYKNKDGDINEMIIDIPDSEKDNIDQCLKNLYGWTLEN